MRTTYTCKLIILQQSHSRLTPHTNLTHFPCSECGNIKSRSIFSVNSINYSLSQLFSQDILYRKFSTWCHGAILAFKERNHSYLQRNCAVMHLNSGFNITRYSIAGGKQISSHHTLVYLQTEMYLCLYLLIHEVKKVKILD